MGSFSASKTVTVYKKFGGRCAYCGDDLGDNFQIDHFIPRSKGGSGRLDNLFPSCSLCNYQKGGRTIEEFRTYRAKMKTGIPYFSKEQSDWLLDRGFYNHLPEGGAFYFEIAS